MSTKEVRKVGPFTVFPGWYILLQLGRFRVAVNRTKGTRRFRFNLQFGHGYTWQGVNLLWNIIRGRLGVNAYVELESNPTT